MTALGVLGLIVVAWLCYSLIRLAWVETLPIKSAVAGSSVQWVKAYDTEIAYQQFGPSSPRTILLVHGTGAWSGTWVSNIDTMVQAGFRVIALDLPPFGFSGRPSTADYSREAQAKRILAFSQNLGLNQPVLLGHSFGGGPVAEAALLAPHLFKSLVFVDAAIGTISATPKQCEDADKPGAVLGMVAFLGVAAVGTQPFMSQTLLKQFVTRKEVVTSERTALYQVPFQKKGFSAGLASWGLQFALGCENPLSSNASRYASLTLPTDIIWGEDDTVTPIDQALNLNRLIKGSRLHPLKGVGHIPQIEDVQSFNETLRKVLSNR